MSASGTQQIPIDIDIGLDIAPPDVLSDDPFFTSIPPPPLPTTPTPTVDHVSASGGPKAITACSPSSSSSSSLLDNAQPKHEVAPSPGGYVIAALPSGWAEKIDPATSRKYYANKELRFTQWIWPSPSDVPPPLPTGWEQKVDPISGKLYFVNSSKSKSQWGRPGFTRPTSTPAVGPDWRECQDAFGKVYYHNRTTKEVRRSKPENQSHPTTQPSTPTHATPSNISAPPMIIPPAVQSPTIVLPSASPSYSRRSASVSVHAGPGVIPGTGVIPITARLLVPGSPNTSGTTTSTPSTPTTPENQTLLEPDSPPSHTRNRSLSSGSSKGQPPTTPIQLTPHSSAPEVSPKKSHHKFSLFSRSKKNKDKDKEKEKEKDSKDRDKAAPSPPLPEESSHHSSSHSSHHTGSSPSRSSTSRSPGTPTSTLSQATAPVFATSPTSSSPSTSTSTNSQLSELDIANLPPHLAFASLPAAYTRGSRMSLPPGLLRRV
ncbi:hypothetical protein Pelo_3067 [Pelomyxa schiedti]|nr:hypothetical protein Pelo_3067 [Pelomyxa schiedti]